jgi:hypothetical protein
VSPPLEPTHRPSQATPPSPSPVLDLSPHLLVDPRSRPASWRSGPARSPEGLDPWRRLAHLTFGAGLLRRRCAGAHGPPRNSTPLGTGNPIPAQLRRADRGGRLGHREEPNEALHRRHVALDCHLPRALRVGERPAPQSTAPSVPGRCQSLRRLDRRHRGRPRSHRLRPRSESDLRRVAVRSRRVVRARRPSRTASGAPG